MSFPAPSWMTRRFASASPKKRFRRLEEVTSSWRRYGLRRWTSTSPKKRMSSRAERPVTRRSRSSSSFFQTPVPSSEETACRSSAEV